VAAYRGDRPSADVAGRTVVVVDDGVATGGTARAALRSVRRRGPGRLVLATPVVAPAVLADLEQDADEVLALVVPPRLGAVSQWYQRFGQTGDDEVVRLLATARRSR
jgi:putative phosphoribosyl transferase